jgi:hypothetical protein
MLQAELAQIQKQVQRQQAQTLQITFSRDVFAAMCVILVGYLKNGEKYPMIGDDVAVTRERFEVARKAFAVNAVPHNVKREDDADPNAEPVKMLSLSIRPREEQPVLAKVERPKLVVPQ